MTVKRELRAFLGTDFRVVPLKRWQTRFRNSLRPWLIRLPRRAMAYRIEVADGRRFKLLQGTRRAQRAVLAIPELSHELADYGHVPRLLWKNETALLVEFIEGQVPDVPSASFAELLGAAYAELHQTRSGTLERGQLIREYGAHVESLAKHGHVSAGTVDRFVRRLETALPEQVVTGMVSADPKDDNFIIDASGTLYMIDLGAFQSNRPIDIFLAGSPLLSEIDRPRFEQSYRAAGGGEQLFRNARELALIELARRSDRLLDTLAGNAQLDRRRRAVQRGRVESQLKEFEALL